MVVTCSSDICSNISPMTAPRLTAQVLASPMAVELLHTVTHGQVTASPAGYRLYGAIGVDPSVRRLAADDLLELRPGRAPMLTARGEDILALA